MEETVGHPGGTLAAGGGSWRTIRRWPSCCFRCSRYGKTLAKHTAGSERTADSGSPLRFHLRHLAGSTDRLSTYLAGSAARRSTSYPN